MPFVLVGMVVRFKADIEVVLERFNEGYATFYGY
jgi:hypothetical protein